MFDLIIILSGKIFVGKTMGKHRNQTQNGIFLKFMEDHQDIARGYTKRDKVLVESLWQELAQSLNGFGPPSKDVNDWRRIWTEWKSEIKKKSAHNKAEASATGGGPFNKFQLTQTEEAIVQLCGIKMTVYGVSGMELGLVDEAELALNDDMPTTSSKRRPESPIISSTPKRIRPENTTTIIKKIFGEDGNRKAELNEKLDQLISVEKENASSLRRIYRAIEKKNNETVANSVKDLKDEIVSFSSQMLKVMQENNKIRKQQLEFDISKFNIENNNNK